MIKTINFNNNQIIADILKLHCNSDVIDADITYSKGNFYKDGIVKEPTLKFDLYPQKEDVIKADCRNLPIDIGSLDTIMFDPPFLATKGGSLNKKEGNIINKRFGVYPTEKELHQFYVDTLVECYRILRVGGVLIFKCQDKVSSGKQYLSHIFIVNEAIKLGYYPADIFILLAKNRIVADWQLKNQKNARKFHSYFIVFKKVKKIIKYV